MLCSTSEAAISAKLLISGYPNSKPSEPEYYIAQIVAVFVKYELDLVKRAVAPSGLPFDEPNFLPSVGTVEKYLSEKEWQRAKLVKYDTLPGPKYSDYVMPRHEPNLFVPCDVPDYDKAEEFSQVADPKYFRREEKYICVDDRKVAGIWVHQSWWFVRYTKTYEQWRSELNSIGTIRRA